MKMQHSVPQDSPLYHDTWTLLRKYRDVVWSLELSVLRIQKKFELEYGKSIEVFLESIYLAGIDFKESGIDDHAKSIEQSYKMLQLVNSAVSLLRSKHKYGEIYYWILYYSFLSPQQYRSADEIVEQLRPHIRDISYRTYYRRRKDAIDALSSILWGYTAKDCLELLDTVFTSTRNLLSTAYDENPLTLDTLPHMRNP